MTVCVFVPGHITGFFNIKNNENPLFNGSCGAGFLLSKGVETTIKPASGKETSIKINDKIDLNNEGIIREVLKIMNVDEPIEITQTISLPIGAGFGTSASSALGVAIGISKLFDLGHSLEKSGQIAHLAEINLGTGLGDVIAELGHGIVLRTKPGAPGIGEIKSFDENDLYVGCKTFDEIKTSQIINDDYYKRIISENGIVAHKQFSKDSSIENFLKQSFMFSKNTGLISGSVLEACETLNEDCDILGASMAMLGETVFAFSETKKALKNSQIKDFNIYKINNEGIKHD